MCFFVLVKILVGYDVIIKEIFIVCLEELKVENCFIVFVIEIWLENNIDLEFCLDFEGLEFLNVLYIVWLSCRVFLLLILKGDLLMIVLKEELLLMCWLCMEIEMDGDKLWVVFLFDVEVLDL